MLFWELGTCSRTFFYIINREFGNKDEVGEIAADPLAGGIIQEGFQCGMLWGSSLASGAAVYRINGDGPEAMSLAIETTAKLMESYKTRTGCVNCKEFTKTNFKNPFQMFRYMVFRAKSCFNLAEDWAPEAIATSREGIESKPKGVCSDPINCASLVAEKLGASPAKRMMVAGLSGGMGLSGEACGALAAAIWLRTIEWVENNPGKMAMKNPNSKHIIGIFAENTGSEFLCHKICGRKFNTLDEHSEYIKSGGAGT